MLSNNFSGYDIEYDSTLIRQIEWYTKKRELFSGSEVLINVSTQKLREIFDVKCPFQLSNCSPSDDPYMIDVYKIECNASLLIQPYVKHKIKLDKYDYFLTSYRREGQ